MRPRRFWCQIAPTRAIAPSCKPIPCTSSALTLATAFALAQVRATIITQTEGAAEASANTLRSKSVDALTSALQVKVQSIVNPATLSHRHRIG